MVVSHFQNNQNFYSLSQHAHKANTSAPGHRQDLRLSVHHGLTDPHLCLHCLTGWGQYWVFVLEETFEPLG